MLPQLGQIDGHDKKSGRALSDTVQTLCAGLAPLFVQGFLGL